MESLKRRSSLSISRVKKQQPDKVKHDWGTKYLKEKRGLSVYKIEISSYLNHPAGLITK